MCNSHKQAPFYCIKCWKTTYYHPASLWQVGSYLLDQHHQDEGLCETLQFQKQFLDSQQIKEDNKEQKWLLNQRISSGLSTTSAPLSLLVPLFPTGSLFLSVSSFPLGPNDAMEQSGDDIVMDNDAIGDLTFENKLDGWLDGSNTDDIWDENFKSGLAETDIQNVVEYLGPSNNNNNSNNSGSVPVPDVEN